MYVCRYHVCVHTISLLPDRLPKNQECHEMWSRKKRKKEAAAAAAAGGGAKEGAGSSNGSATTANAKLTLPDLSRSRSQSGSPVKEPHQQRSGSAGPSKSGGDGISLSQLTNGSLQPTSKPQGGGGGGGGGGGASARNEAGGGEGSTDKEKKLKNLKKVNSQQLGWEREGKEIGKIIISQKLKQIEQLKQQQAEGKVLESNQVHKILLLLLSH